MSRRSSVNLMGTRIEQPMNLDGKKITNIGELDIDYLDFKIGIINNFLDPMVNADHKTVQDNNYNFDYITSRLNFYRNDGNSNEIYLMQKVVGLMKEASKTRISYNDMYQRIYGDNGLSMNTLIFETSRIMMKAPFEIYDSLFGIKKGQTYNKEIIGEIENILQSHPGIMFNDIKRKIDLLNFVLD